MPKFELGRLIWAVISDRNGYAKPHPRPAMVVKTVAAEGDDEIPVIVGTTRIIEPLPDDQVIIHADYNRDPNTKLSRPTALVLTWVACVRCADVEVIGGFIPGRKAYPIIEKSLKLTRQPSQDEDVE